MAVFAKIAIFLLLQLQIAMAQDMAGIDMTHALSPRYYLGAAPLDKRVGNCNDGSHPCK
jgi:hypothetical protein